MIDSARRERLEAWVADFCDTPAYAALPPSATEIAPELLVVFLDHACRARDVDPGDLEESDVRAGLMDGVGGLSLPPVVRAAVPDLCGELLAALEVQGRLSGGRALGLYARALRQAYDAHTSEKPQPIRRAAARVGRNDVCPCGSGRKYKKCCMRD